MFVSDPSLTYWVMVPIFVTMLLVSLLQDNLRVLFLSSSSRKVSVERLSREQLLVRANRLRTNHGLLPESSFRRKRAFFTNKEEGALSQIMAERARDPVMVKMTLSLIDSWGGGAGGNMMKQYILNFVPTILLGVFINHFFSGFAVGCLPFPLPLSSRSMLLNLCEFGVSFSPVKRKQAIHRIR